VGVSAYVRIGVDSLTSWTPLNWHGLDYPAICLIDHFYDLRNDFVALIVECFEGRSIDISVVKGDLEMNLRFARLGLCIVQLRYKGCFIASFSPSLSDVGANRAG
jgi:hypothetical protein